MRLKLISVILLNKSRLFDYLVTHLRHFALIPIIEEGLFITGLKLIEKLGLGKIMSIVH